MSQRAKTVKRLLKKKAPTKPSKAVLAEVAAKKPPRSSAFGPEEKEELAHLLREQALDYQERAGVRSKRTLLRLAAREESFKLDLQEKLGDWAKRLVPPTKVKVPKKGFDERTVNLVLSDLHFGADLDSREVPLPYGRVEEARRLSAVVREAVAYKPQYRSRSRLNVHLIGDIFQGQLHDMRDGAPLAEQCARAIYLLTTALATLAKEYPTVDVWCSTGNHGRNKARHQDRAVHQKWDSIESIVYFAIHQALQHVPNVTVHIPLSPFYVWDAYDKKGLGTHGDTVLKPGYPSGSVNVASLEAQAAKLQAGLGHPVDLFLVGHVHTGAIVNLQTGSTLMTNGALIPSDSFGVSLGSLRTGTGQWIWESVPGHILGDSRFIRVGPKDDGDSALDKIIKPWAGFPA